MSLRAVGHSIQIVSFNISNHLVCFSSFFFNRFEMEVVFCDLVWNNMQVHDCSWWWFMSLVSVSQPIMSNTTALQITMTTFDILDDSGVCLNCNSNQYNARFCP